MRDSWVIALLSTLSVLVMGSLAWANRDRVMTGHNDFVSFYTGARLAGTGGLYDVAQVRAFQEQLLGRTSDAWRFIRLPYFAALLWPLGRLPFHTAYLVWEALAIAAVAGFVLLWKPTARPITVLFTCLSLPVAVALMNGQDLTFVLLFLAASVYALRQGRPFLAGLAFALCAVKFHLFLLAPLLLVNRRNWTWGAGAAAGLGVLLLVSFAVAGPAWPGAYYRVLTDPNIHPGLEQMPSLHGLVGRWGWPAPVEWILAAAVAGVVAVTAARRSFEYALAAALAGGVLVSYHSYLADCALLLPATLIVLTETASRPLRMLTVVLLTPLTGFLLVMNSPATGAVMPLAVLALLGLIGLDAARRAEPAEG